MRTNDICALGVAPVADDNAHLYLWVTNNFLRDGFRVCEAWGFRYVTLITWGKPTIGLGQYFRGQTEHCIFAVRGNLPYRTTSEGKRAQGTTLLSAPKREHSRKPDEMRGIIERVSYPPYLELFAREAAPGWDIWGNEVSATAELGESKGQMQFGVEP